MNHNRVLKKSIVMLVKEKIVSFIKETQSELKRTSWPSKEETIRYTWVVILMSLFLVLVLGGLDYIFTYLVSKYIL